jgi:hypothetical protein
LRVEQFQHNSDSTATYRAQQTTTFGGMNPAFVELKLLKGKSEMCRRTLKNGREREKIFCRCGFDVQPNTLSTGKENVHNMMHR